MQLAMSVEINRAWCRGSLNLSSTFHKGGRVGSSAKSAR